MSIWNASIDVANRVYSIAYFTLIISTAFIIASTASLYWSSAIRDRFSQEKLSSVLAGAAQTIAVAQLGAAKAQERTSTLEEQNTQLQARNIELQKEAEEYQSDKERETHTDIILRATPPVLPSSPVHELEHDIKAFPGTTADILITEHPDELHRLGGVISDILAANGWHPHSWPWSGASGHSRQVIVMLKPLADAEIAKAAGALTRDLNEVGIETRLLVWPSEWNRIGGLVSGPVFAENQSPIRVVVGAGLDE